MKHIEKIILECDKLYNEISSRTLCFSGHRPQNLPWGFNEKDKRYKNLKKELLIKIESEIKNGFETFISGLALGFDMLCAEIVIKLKKKYPHIKLIGAIPCYNQSKKWSYSQKVRYIKIIKNVDILRCINKTYNKECMRERNIFMINNSSKVIALYDKIPGGTQQTINYAKKTGITIEILNPNNY